jgi:outer membrane immunogenic protein
LGLAIPADAPLIDAETLFRHSASQKLGASAVIKVKSIVLAGVLALAISPFALASDLPAPAMPTARHVSPVPVFSWTGFYIGGGLGWADSSNKYGAGAAIPALGVGGAVVFPTITKNGLTGSIFTGYNYQVSQIVFGIEADLMYRMIGEARYNQAWGDYLTAHTNWGGSIRGRVGYAIDRALLYATGGAAFQFAKATYGGFWGSIGLGDDTRWGWTLGGGLEYAFTQHWIGGIEYRYTDLGTDTFTWPAGFAHNLGVAAITQSTSSNQVTGRIGYKF